LSLVSCLNKYPNTVISTITFYRALVSDINCLLLGPLAVSDFFQGKDFVKIPVKKGLEFATKKMKLYVLFQVNIATTKNLIF
tara:strand:+ start:393 stop:638 length:246 start_codon:yes stop_codon:yes gene_type:complete